MAILKLKEAGEEATLDIVTAEVIEGQYGKQVRFDANTGDVLYVPLGSVERQLDRCGVGEVEALSGKTIHFSRAANSKPGSAPFWNMDRAKEGDVVKKPVSNGKSLPPTAQKLADSYVDKPLPGEEEESGFDALLKKYTECVSEAVGLAQRIGKAGIPVDGSAVSSMAATLFIARKDARV